MTVTNILVQTEIYVYSLSRFSCSLFTQKNNERKIAIHTYVSFGSEVMIIQILDL